MSIEPDTLQDLVGTSFRDRARFRSALAHLVSSPPDHVCMVPLEGKSSEYVLGDSYIARLWQGDACGLELHQLAGAISARVTLETNPAVSYMVGSPRGSHLETLYGTTVVIAWKDGVTWTLGGPEWANALAPSGYEIEPVLDLIWEVVRRIAPKGLEMTWPQPPSA